MNRVFEIEFFKDLRLKLSRDEIVWIEKVKAQLKENLLVGKHLTYFYLREKRLGDKRLYFFINLKTRKALLVAYGNKKTQRKTVDFLIQNKKSYLDLIS